MTARVGARASFRPATAHPPGGGARARRLLLLPLALFVGACTLAPGDRVGRVPPDPAVIRIGVPALPRSLDPALARTDVEVAIASALFSTLVTVDADGAPRAGLATSWTLAEGSRVLRLELSPDARFSDGAALSAHDVVWSWQRALRATTGALDKSAFDAVEDGHALVSGVLLRAAAATVLSQPPFSSFDPRALGARDAPAHALVPLGARVRVVDSNARRPCCGGDVSLLSATSVGEAVVATLEPADVARVLAARVVDGERWLRLRHPDGRAGWARDAEVAVVVPPVAVRRVVERGDGSLAIRSGPDADAPVRDVLKDDDTIELLERGPDFSLVLDARTGRAGFLRSDVIDEVLGERWWLEVVLEPERALDAEGPPAPGDAARGWISASALVFDPSMLAARAADAHTIEVALAPGVQLAQALAALATPLLAPVPARRVDEAGYAWAAPERIETSGTFALGAVTEDALHLLRTNDALPSRVVLVRETDATAALHRYRAGELDALWDGLLPPPLRKTLERAADFVPGPRGGALAAPEIAGFTTVRPSLEQLRPLEERSAEAAR